MKKYVIYGSLIAILGLVGCSSSAENVDQNIKKQVIVDGKKFSIPSGAIPSPHLASTVEVNFFKKSGVSECKEGDITWEAASVKGEVANAIKNGDASIHKDLVKAGKIGCASPIK